MLALTFAATAFTAPSIAIGASRTAIRTTAVRGALAATSTLQPLFDFGGASADAALAAWERIDDVIMGGISSSRLTKESDGAVFEGRLREQGGGFCGQRMRLLSEPMDLSFADGLYLDCEATNDGADPSTRVWKVAMRTKQDRGEVVYQTTFEPPRSRGVVKLPFESFRLVRGPRLVPDVAPLSAAQANETYQVSLVVSKFTVSETGEALPGFVEGPFALKFYQLGTFGADGATLTPATVPAPPRALTEKEQKAAAPLVLKLLRPLLGLLFSETSRRRNAATKLLEARGTSKLQRARLAWAWRVAGGGLFGAAKKTTTIALRDLSALLLSIPAKLLFKLVVLTSRTIKRARGLMTPADKAAAKVPLKA